MHKMKEKTPITSLLTQYAGPAKIIITILITIVTTVWGVAIYYSKAESKKAADSAMVVETHVVVMQVKHQLDSMLIWMRDFDGQLNAVHDNTVLIGNYVESVHAGIKEDLRTRKDAEFQHYVKITSIIEEGLKKKAQLDSIESAQILDSLIFTIKVTKVSK